MAIPVDVDRLEKFDQVRDEEIFRQLMVWNIQFFHQVDEGRQLKASRVKLELFL